jgi:hypothetical protein
VVVDGEVLDNRGHERTLIDLVVIEKKPTGGARAEVFGTFPEVHDLHRPQ